MCRKLETEPSNGVISNEFSAQQYHQSIENNGILVARLALFKCK